MEFKMELSLKEIIKIDHYRNYGTEFKILKVFFNKKVRFLVLFRVLQKFYKKEKISLCLKIIRKIL